MGDFSKAIDIVIKTHEGGFQNRRDDPGNFTPSGELKGTKYGISAHSFPDVDIKNLTLQGAEGIYRPIYGGFAAIADQRVLDKIVDLSIDMEYGTHGPATKILQDAINKCGGQLSVDGDFGPQTIAACNALSAGDLLPAICVAAAAHYLQVEARNPGMKGWFNNWNTRAMWMPPLEIVTTHA